MDYRGLGSWEGPGTRTPFNNRDMFSLVGIVFPGFRESDDNEIVEEKRSSQNPRDFKARKQALGDQRWANKQADLKMREPETRRGAKFRYSSANYSKLWINYIR